MPIVSDFTTILGDSNVTIGDGSNEAGWTKSFNTGGRHSPGTAFISFMVRGMTVSTSHATVFVNDKNVGTLFNNNGGNRNHWATQTVSLNGTSLNNGSNVIRVMPVTNQTSSTDDFDDYTLRNVICHFHQSA